MDSTIFYLFEVALGLLTLDHLTMGFLGVFAPSLGIRVYKKIFGLDLEDSEASLLLLRPWGALGIFAGLIGLVIALDHARYENLLWILIILLGLRVYIRLTLKQQAEKAFHLSKTRNLIHICLILTCTLALILQLQFN